MKTSDQIKPLSDHQDSTGESLESGPHLFPPSISGVDERVLVSNMNQNKTADMNLEIGLIVELARTLTSTCQPTWKHFAHCGVFYFLRCRRLRVTRRNTKQRENKVSNIAASILSLSPLGRPICFAAAPLLFLFFCAAVVLLCQFLLSCDSFVGCPFFPVAFFVCVCVCVCVCPRLSGKSCETPAAAVGYRSVRSVSSSAAPVSLRRRRQRRSRHEAFRNEILFDFLFFFKQTDGKKSSSSSTGLH